MNHLLHFLFRLAHRGPRHRVTQKNLMPHAAWEKRFIVASCSCGASQALEDYHRMA